MIELKKKTNLFGAYGGSKPEKQNIDRQRERLAELKRLFHTNLCEAWAVVKEIKESDLWKLEADTWEQFCREQLGRSIRGIRENLQMLQIAEAAGITAQSSASTEGGSMKIIEQATRAISRGMPGTTVEKKATVLKRVMAQKPGNKADLSAKLAAELRKAMPKKTEVEMPENKQRGRRWRQALAKLEAAMDRDEEGLLEAVEQMLENWGL